MLNSIVQKGDTVDRTRKEALPKLDLSSSNLVGVILNKNNTVICWKTDGELHVDEHITIQRRG